MILLAADDVSFGFPGHELFEHVTMSVQEGERVALVAPNGAGKTTLLRILRGVIEPDDGRVALAKDTTIGMLDQERELLGLGQLARDRERHHCPVLGDVPRSSRRS